MHTNLIIKSFWAPWFATKKVKSSFHFQICMVVILWQNILWVELNSGNLFLKLVFEFLFCLFLYNNINSFFLFTIFLNSFIDSFRRIVLDTINICIVIGSLEIFRDLPLEDWIGLFFHQICEKKSRGRSKDQLIKKIWWLDFFSL